MKNLRIAFTAILLCFCFVGFAQKVKIKKGMVLIDDTEMYTTESEGTMQSLSTLNGNEFLSMVGNSYEVPNPGRSLPGGHNHPATIKKWVYTVKFLESGKEIITDMGLKEIAKAVYKSNMVDQDGKIDEQKLNIFVTKYNNENLKYKLVN